MKKLFSLLLALMLLCCAALAEEAVVPANRILAVDSAYAGLADMNPQFKGTESTIRGCLGLQPARNEDGTFADAFLNFYVEVETAGLYEITICYAAKFKAGQTRCADMIVNEGERIHLPIEGQEEWTVYVPAKVVVELNAGVNTIALVNVEGFDNSVYKAINVDYIEWNPAPAEAIAE